MNRSVAAAALVFLLAACSPEVSGTAGSGDGPAGPSIASDFVVAAGEDGVAQVTRDGFQKLSGMRSADVSAAGLVGPIAAWMPTEDLAVVVADGKIATVRASGPAIVSDCPNCSGAAAAGVEIVTSRRAFRLPGSFDLLFLDTGLSVQRTVPSERVPERGHTAYPPENRQSPVTLAASSSAVTVGYLARSGGIRAGPSVIAQYSLNGDLRGHVVVDGIIGRSAASPDGRYLAMAIGGSGGACITSSDLEVVDLTDMRILNSPPKIPNNYQPNPAGWGEPWFEITDLSWTDDLTVTATGLIYDPPRSESCDPRPDVW